MTASEIVARGRRLADLEKSTFIAREDEVESLNESWRDIYAALCEENDDYFLEEVTFSLIPAYVVDTNVWRVPLPDDFYKLRTVDYRGATEWVTVDKYPQSQRNDGAASLCYRLENQNIRFIGNNGMAAAGQVRIRYYPNPEALSVPAVPLVAGYGKTLAQIAALREPFYVAEASIMLYAQGNNIVAENLKTKTVTTLYAGASPATFIRYYRGNIYFILAGLILSAATDLTAVFVPAAIVGPANVISLEVWGNALYYCEHPAGYNTYRRPIGGAAVLLGAFQSRNVSKYGSGYIYVNGAGTLTTDTGATSTLTAQAMTTDPDGNVYTLDGQTVWKYALDVALDPITSYALNFDAAYLGPWAGDRVPIYGYEESYLWALSTFEDSDVSYPSNIVPQIMAYQSAIDYNRKQKLPRPDLDQRKAELVRTMIESIKRDSYQHDRINQFYRSRGQWI